MGGSVQEPSAGAETPAWNEVLAEIPEQFREQVTPALQKWDQSNQGRISQLEQQYQQWKPFMENQTSPKDVEAALGLVSAIDANPRQVIEAMQQYYNLTPAQQAQVGAPPQFPGQQPQLPGQQQQGEEIDPRILALQQQVDLLTRVSVKTHEQTQAEREDAMLERELTTLHGQFKKQYGFDFNEKAVLGYAQGFGVDVAEAAKAWYDDQIQTAQSMQTPAPRLLGSGGGIPSTRPDVRTMDENAFRDYATEYVKSFNARNSGG